MKLALGVLLLAGLVAAPSPDDTGFAADVDREVAKISGYRNPTPRCDDGEYLRRVMLDLVGYPPNAEELGVFVADPNPKKRAAKVDELLATWRHADFWARRWMGVFFGNYHAFKLEPLKSEDPAVAARLMESFRVWLKGRLHDDASWNEIVRALLEAEGKAVEVPALAYKLGNIRWPRRPQFENRVSQHFLGIDLSCTGCHDHPFDQWSVDDGYRLMAYSAGRTLRRGPQGLEVEEGPEIADQRVWIPTISADRDADVRRRLYVSAAFFLSHEKPAPNEVLAKALARSVTADANVQFRHATVNRVWVWLMGRGIVWPVDMFDLKNKPLLKSLLVLLSDRFKADGGRFRGLIRGICLSEAYQRRSDDPEPISKATFSRGVVRPLSAEQILNSLETATQGRPTFDVAASQSLAELLMRGEPWGCETTGTVPDPRAFLWLANGDRVWSLIRESRVLAAIRNSGEDPVKAMFRAALSRDPDEEEAARYGEYLRVHGPAGLDDAYWTLLNSMEFLTRH